jgi:hypothetical protein
MRSFSFLILLAVFVAVQAIVNDAEHEHVKKLNHERWAVSDKEVDEKLQALHKKHGRPPNIVHYLWDDTAFGDVGIVTNLSYFLGFDVIDFFCFFVAFAPKGAGL